MNTIYKNYVASKPPHKNESALQRYYYIGTDKEPIEHYKDKDKQEELYPFISEEELQELCTQAEKAISKKLDDIFKDIT